MVTFTKAATKQARKQEQKPSLNVLQPKCEKAQQGEIRRNDALDKIASEQAAQQNAWDLYQNIHKKSEVRPEDFFVLGPGNVIKIGTDCSGLEAPVQAIKNLGIPFQHSFSCDNDIKVCESIKSSFSPKTLYTEITERDHSKTPAVDLYVAGFPCQPFSMAGKKQGFEDEKGRGIIFWHILDYIEKQKPKVFTLENVKGLVTLQNGKYMKQILKALQSISSPKSKTNKNETAETQSESLYNIYHQVMNTKDHGIPQNRARWYCVGILKKLDDKCGFEFPQSIATKPISTFLDSQNDLEPDSPPESSQLAKQNVQRATEQIKENGGDPKTETFIIDCDASTQKMKWIKELSPCITRSRNHGHWITNLDRRFSKTEMFRLQGMDPTRFVQKVSDAALGQQIGNAMSV